MFPGRAAKVSAGSAGRTVTPAREYWDTQAAVFDEEPDHGLRDPEVRRAWWALLRQFLPSPPVRIADLGCGTGSLSVLCAEQGHSVHGVDLSDQMVSAARTKASAADLPAGVSVAFDQGDASDPDLGAGAFDVVLSRHVLWALPDPAAALSRWISLLQPGGRLVLVEGHWFTGGGLSASRCEALVREHRQAVVVHPLDDPALWGREVDDERYLLVSTS